MVQYRGIWERQALCHLRTHSYASALHYCPTDASVLTESREGVRIKWGMIYVGGWALALIDRTVLVFLSCLDSLDGNFAKTKQKKVVSWTFP